jgi:hypothetical protein
MGGDWLIRETSGLVINTLFLIALVSFFNFIPRMFSFMFYRQSYSRLCDI